MAKTFFIFKFQLPRARSLQLNQLYDAQSVSVLHLNILAQTEYFTTKKGAHTNVLVSRANSAKQTRSSAHLGSVKVTEPAGNGTLTVLIPIFPLVSFLHSQKNVFAQTRSSLQSLIVCA